MYLDKKKIVLFSILPILAGLIASLAIWTDENGAIVTALHTGWGDLLFHLRASLFFSAQGLPNESFLLSGMPVGYAFLVDYISSLLHMLNIPIGLSFLLPTILFTVITVAVFQYVVLYMTKSLPVAILATLLLFFFGSLSGFYTIPELLETSATWQENLRDLPHYVTFWPQESMVIPNPLITILHQRAYLFGLPLFMLLLWFTWKAVVEDNMLALAWSIPIGTALAFSHPYTWGASLILLPSWIGLMWLLRLRKFSQQDFWRFTGSFFLIAVLGYLIVKTLQPNASTSIIQWNIGWLEPTIKWPLFWIKNIGIHFFLIPFAWIHLQKSNKPLATLLLASAIPFIAANIFQFAPWEWDNTKVFTLVWIVVCIANGSLLIHWLQQKNTLSILATLAIVIAIFTGGLEIVRAVVRLEHPYQLVSREYLLAGQEIQSLTNPDDVIATSSGASNPIFLTSGRPSLTAYAGWLWSGGWKGKYEDREQSIKTLFAGGPASEIVIDKYNINLVAIGPGEVQQGANTQWFEGRYEKLPLTYGEYSVYRVRP